MKYQIHYFSATGNTDHSVRLVGEYLKAKGHEVETISVDFMPANKPAVSCDVLIVAFPVLAFTAPYHFLQYVKKIPKTKTGIPAAIIACAGENGLQACAHMRRILARRGYDVFLSSDVSYPENWKQVGLTMPPEKQEHAILTGDEKTKIVAKKILDKQVFHYRVNRVLSTLTRVIAFLFCIFGRRFLGKMHIADSDCNSCGLCKKTCPMNSIVLGTENNSKPYWKLSCESCNRCLNICPKNAINSSIARSVSLLLSITIFSVFFVMLWLKFLPWILQTDSAFFQAADAAGITLMIILGHWVGIVLVDRFVLKPLQSGMLRNVFSKTFTKASGQYWMKGFKPTAKNKNNK